MTNSSKVVAAPAHILPDGIRVLCRIDRAKNEIGIKFYCFVCNRYVWKGHVDENWEF